VTHWFQHVLGLDNGSGGWYLWWSGFGANFSEFAMVGALWGIVRKHNCHVRWCPRIGRFPVEATRFVVCLRHHPDDAPTAQDLL
jgi:hypothetical protein